MGDVIGFKHKYVVTARQGDKASAYKLVSEHSFFWSINIWLMEDSDTTLNLIYDDSNRMLMIDGDESDQIMLGSGSQPAFFETTTDIIECLKRNVLHYKRVKIVMTPVN
jgi:hypothetical protein